jgi:hypothetical protein
MEMNESSGRIEISFDVHRSEYLRGALRGEILSGLLFWFFLVPGVAFPIALECIAIGKNLIGGELAAGMLLLLWFGLIIALPTRGWLKSYKGTHIVRIFDTGVEYHAGTNNWTAGWERFRRLSDLGDLYLLRWESGWIVIPKRSLLRDQEEQILRIASDGMVERKWSQGVSH